MVRVVTFFLLLFCFAAIAVAAPTSVRTFSRPPTMTHVSPPKVVQNVTVNRTTIVRQSSPTPISGGGGGGLGFFGTMAASGLGAAIANAIQKPSQPTQQVIDCSLPQNRQVQGCAQQGNQ